MSLSKRQIDIIEATTKLIGESGIQNLTIKNLAAEMGFSEPALYRHFKGKTEILKSVLIYYKEKLGKELKRIVNSDLSGLKKINKMVAFQFKHFTNFPAIVMVIFAETSFQYDSELSKVVSEIMTQKKIMVSNIIKEGQNEGSVRNDINAEQLTTIVMGGMRLTVLEWRLSGFSFNLIKKGKELRNTIELLLKNK
ncbi:MAG: TetR/AcrR family transcriptional regulator [Cyclobacteriaceae bacterium]|nr:TetR/AcrR family transcriptional regulator [Cyclobacteriaceae bacterium]